MLAVERTALENIAGTAAVELVWDRKMCRDAKRYFRPFNKRRDTRGAAGCLQQ